MPGLRLSPKVPRISFKLKIDGLIFGADIFEVIGGFPKEIIGTKIGNLGLKNKFESPFLPLSIHHCFYDSTHNVQNFSIKSVSFDKIPT